MSFGQQPEAVFHLGRINVEETLEPGTATTITEKDYRLRNYRVISDAINLLPGVSVHRQGNRNDRGIFVRGFDMRQVPLYIDGIPVYVPYDGFADFDRFLTYDVSEIQVTKGFTSPLYGPNALGGSVNLISKAPVKPLNLDLGTGFGSGGLVNGFVNAGTRQEKFWLQGGFASLSSDNFPLPSGHRLNAYQSDHKGRAKVAWTPNASDQYTFTYAVQKGEKGNPLYLGTSPNVSLRFWQWPYWDKESFYFISNTAIAETSYVRARLYYDKFENMVKAFDDATYSTQNRPYAFTSPYDDDTYGTTLEAGTKFLPKHSLKSSFYFKDDTHREGNVGEPPRSFRDQSLSFGIEDTIELSSRSSVIAGFSADHLTSRNAENYQNGVILPFPRTSVWAYNPQLGFFHALSSSAKLHFTFARKSRLPTILDRYSYRLGTGIPNPELRPEKSNNWEVGYSQVLGTRTFVEGALFLSQVSDSTQRFYLQPNLYQLRNLGESRYRGGEFQVRTSLTPALAVTANYTYLSRRNNSNPALILVSTPRHKVYSSVTYQLSNRATLLADYRYEGGRWNQNDAGIIGRSPQFASVGLGATARLYRGMEVQAGVDNLGNRSYFLVEGYPEPGRALYLNLRYRF